MKILIVTDAWYPQLNGVVRTYEYLREELVKLGHDIKIIGPSDFPLTLAMPGYAEIRLALLPYRRLKKMIEAYKPNHIHVATEGPLGWAARKYCVRHKVPFTTSYHTQFPEYTAKRIGHYLPFLHKTIYKGGIVYVRTFHEPAGAVMVATQTLEDELKSWNFKNPMKRVSRGADLSLFSPGQKTLFHDLKKPVALYVGRIAIEKNLEEFLAMDWPGSKVLVGEGPSMPYLSQKYPDAIFLGRRTGKELADCYRSADLFAFPSRTDTFGIVLVEALACGLPIAGYNVAGPRDIITESFLGSIDDIDLAAAAARALKETDSARRAAHARQHYTWENAAQQFMVAIKDYCMGS